MSLEPRTHKYQCRDCRAWVYADSQVRNLDGTPHEHWRNAEMACAICSHEWVATYPEAAPVLECPGCGHMSQRPDA